MYESVVVIDALHYVDSVKCMQHQAMCDMYSSSQKV